MRIKVFAFLFCMLWLLSFFGVAAEINSGFSFLIKRAEKGDKISQYILGKKLFLKAKHKNQVNEALKWLKKSANNKYIPAVVFLAEIYEKGEKVKVDYLKAFKWYKRALDLGSVVAKEKLGFLFVKSSGFTFFEVPIFSLNRFGVRYEFQKHGAKIVKLSEGEDFCDVFDTSSIFVGSDKTQVCYLPTRKLAFFELRFPYNKGKQNIYLNRYFLSLKEKYGIPRKKDNMFIWSYMGIEILLWLEPKTNTVFLRYRQPDREKKLLKYKKELEKQKLMIPTV